MAPLLRAEYIAQLSSIPSDEVPGCRFRVRRHVRDEPATRLVAWVRSTVVYPPDIPETVMEIDLDLPTLRCLEDEYPQIHIEHRPLSWWVWRRRNEGEMGCSPGHMAEYTPKLP